MDYGHAIIDEIGEAPLWRPVTQSEAEQPNSTSRHPIIGINSSAVCRPTGFRVAEIRTYDR